MIYKYRGIFRLHDHSFNLWGSPFKVEIPGRSTPRLTADPPFADCVGAACCLVSSGLAHLQLTTLVSKSPKTSVTGILKHFGYASGWEKKSTGSHATRPGHSILYIGCSSFLCSETQLPGRPQKVQVAQDTLVIGLNTPNISQLNPTKMTKNYRNPHKNGKAMYHYILFYVSRILLFYLRAKKKWPSHIFLGRPTKGSFSEPFGQGTLQGTSGHFEAQLWQQVNNFIHPKQDQKPLGQTPQLPCASQISVGSTVVIQLKWC